jgi:hypothetical protein
VIDVVLQTLGDGDVRVCLPGFRAWLVAVTHASG